jgi:hypothetical protein
MLIEGHDRPLVAQSPSGAHLADRLSPDGDSFVAPAHASLTAYA